MSWQQITFRLNRDQLSSAEDALLELGALCITLKDAEDNPILEPLPDETPLWANCLLTALFNEDTDTKAIIHSLEEQLHQPFESCAQAEALEDQAWERTCMQDFHPQPFGQRLWVVPSWSEAPEPNAVNIKLDPGLAFGTGTHPTTHLCLEWLDQNPPTHKTVIDYGCGSGILAIAALKLGAASCLATDIDPQAITATSINATTNNVSDALVCGTPDQLTMQPADLLLANILSGPLVELSDTLSALIKTGGSLVLSGILKEQSAAVIEAYTQTFDLDEPVFKDNWTRISGTRK